MRLSEIVERVIEQAKIVALAEEAELRTLPGYPVIRTSDLASLPDLPVPEWEELCDFIAGLPVATIYMLTVLMYLGRGDYTTENLLEAYMEVSDSCHKPKTAIRCLLSKAMLHIYLCRAMECLSEDNIDVDRLLES